MRDYRLASALWWVVMTLPALSRFLTVPLHLTTLELEIVGG